MPYGTDTYGVEAFGSEGPAPAQTIEFTTGIASEEAVGEPNPQFTLDFTTGIASAEVVGNPQIDLTIMPDGIASAEAVGQPSLEFIVTPDSIPSQESVGEPQPQFIVRPDSIWSEESVGNPTITTNFIPGWSVRVFRLTGEYVAEVGRWQKCRFQDVLSGKGVGQIDFLWEDAVTIGLLNDEFVWRVFYDGELAFSFLTQAVNEAVVQADQRQLATFSGPGIAEVLTWATVLPPDWPVWQNRSWTWTDVRAMKAWRDLFNAAKDRGTLPMVTASFSDAADTDGAAWTDAVTLEVEPGGTLYDYMEKLASYAGADWRLSPSWSLDARLNYGRHLEEKVRFQVAADQVKLGRGRNRADLRNVGYVEGGVGGIQEAVDNGSVTKWGRREVYVQAGDAQDVATTQSIAARLVDQTKDERIQILCSVLPDGAGRKVFHDYALGDWVGLNGVLEGDWRCIAVTVEINDQGLANVELGLQSLFEYQERKLERLAANGGSSTIAPGQLQSGLTPGGVIEAVTNAPPPPAPTGLTLGTGANENRVYLDVSWTSVSPSGPDPVTEYEVEVTRSGAGVEAAVRTTAAPVRVEPVEPGVEYSVRVRAISRFGRSSAFLGPQTITAGVDTTIPAQATGLSVGAGVRTLTATWNDNTELDVKDGKGSYDLQIDTVNTFDSGNLRGKRVGGTIASFTDLAQTTLYYVRVRAVDSSGNAGPWSVTQSTTTQQVGNSDIATGAVDTLKIADGAITTAKIGDAQITNAKIIDLSASKLTAGTIQAAQITLGSGGLFRAGRSLSPFHYLFLDENGLRFYKNGSAQFTGGTLSFEANVSTGNVSLTGAITASSLTTTGPASIGSTLDVAGVVTLTGAGKIRTAASGERMELAAGYGSDIQFFSGQGSETAPGIVDAQVSATRGQTSIISPNVSGSDSRAFAAFRSAPTSGGWANLSLGAANHALTAGFDRKFDFHCYLHGGAARFYYSGGNIYIENNVFGLHNGGGWFQDGDSTYVRSLNDKWIYTGNQVRGGSACMASYGYRAVFGHAAALNMYGGPGEIYGAALYQGDNGGDKGTYLNCYEGGWVQILSHGNWLMQWALTGSLEWRLQYDVPVLGGMDMLGRVNNSFRQIGRATSSAAYKKDIIPAEFSDEDPVDLQGTTALTLIDPVLDPNHNPIFDIKVRRYKYNNQVGNADEINIDYPRGLVGLIAEEVAVVMPQGVNWWRNDDGSRSHPTSVDTQGLMSHVIAGLQHTHKSTHRQAVRIKALEEQVAAIMRFPALANFLTKGK